MTQAGVRKSGGLYESFLLNALAPMQQGALRLIGPDGEVRMFGRSGESSAAVIRVRHPDFYRKCVLFGDVGFGESYVDGDWDTDSVSDVIRWFLLNIESAPDVSGSRRRHWKFNVLSFLNRLVHRLRRNSAAGSRRNIREHYDLSNDFFRLFLDPGMTYSGAYFESSGQSLADAQTAKIDRLCRKLRLSATDHVLEIGSGWGGFAVHAAKTYGCRVTGITISQEQYEYASRRVRDEGLEDRISIRLIDYRNVEGQFDKIVSIEMLEAVGDPYYETFFEKCHATLKPAGLLGIQVITCPDSRYETFRRNVDWIQKHIFPGSLLPSIARLTAAARRTGDLQLFELEDMGMSYVRTLAEWRRAFDEKLDRVRALGFDEPFIRKWIYYLEYCRAAFQMRNITVVQAVMTRPNNPLLIESPRSA